MPGFSELSLIRLNTCDERLIILFTEIVKHFDCVVLYGNRSQDEQMNLFKQGREYLKGEWIITDLKKIVTYCDGISKKSNHNYSPSKAIDCVPYPINWKNTERIYYFAGWVKCKAAELGMGIRWGGDWDNDTEVRDQTFMDLAHYEII